MCDTLKPSSGNPMPESKWQSKTRLQQGNTEQEKEQAVTFDKATTIAKYAHRQSVDDADEQKEQDALTVEEYHRQDEQILPTEQTGAPMHESDEPQPTESERPPLQQTEGGIFRQTRSGRQPKQTSKWQESELLREQNILALHVPWEVFHDGEFDLQDRLHDPMSFAASSNPDIMCLKEAMAADDAKQFRKAMADEVPSHVDHDHWQIVKQSETPPGAPILPAVWAFRRKRRIDTQEVHKWKARLNTHGGMQEHEVNYWETYVVGWSSIRLFLTMMIMNNWASKQVDFVLAFPQADIECDMCMSIPQGFHIKGDPDKHCLKLKKNLYGQKQAGRVWNNYLHEGLVARGFKQSIVDMCIYYRGAVTLLIYVDDGIFLADDMQKIDKCYRLLTTDFTDSNGRHFRAFRMTDEGDLSDYLGVKIERLANGLIKLYQPHLVDNTLQDLSFNARTKQKATPAATSVRLDRDVHGQQHTNEWHCRSIVGKLNFLEKSTRPDIACAAHQCTRFSSDPKQSHAQAIKRIRKYLVRTRTEGIILNPTTHSFDCWVDADFVGNWSRLCADVDPATAKSRTGYLLTHGSCPLVWALKLQREVVLSTTEAEYNALSESLRHAIHVMQLIDEIKEHGWPTPKAVPTVHCKVFEDNVGSLEMARLPKMRPRTKHIGVRMHHFRECVRQKLITMHKIPCECQLADILTKPQLEQLFTSQRESTLQWLSASLAKAELLKPAKHLRACEIAEQADHLNEMEDQHARPVMGTPEPKCLSTDKDT